MPGQSLFRPAAADVGYAGDFNVRVGLCSQLLTKYQMAHPFSRVFACGLIVLLAAALAAAADPPAEARTYMVQITFGQERDGRQAVIAQPTVVAADGEEASYVSGGEVQFDPETKQRVPYGIRARVRVRELEDGRLRVSLQAAVGDLEEQREGDALIREWAVRCVRTVAPAETIEIEFADDRKVAVIVRPVTRRE